MLGISKKEDTSGNLKRSKIKKNSEDFQQIITAIEEKMDPFSVDLDKNELFNISSGRAVTHEISASLLKVCEFGETARLVFIDDELNAMRIHQGLRSQLNDVISKHAKMPTRNTKCVGKMRKRKQRLLRW